MTSNYPPTFWLFKFRSLHLRLSLSLYFWFCKSVPGMFSRMPRILCSLHTGRRKIVYGTMTTLEGAAARWSFSYLQRGSLLWLWKKQWWQNQHNTAVWAVRFLYWFHSSLAVFSFGWKCRGHMLLGILLGNIPTLPQRRKQPLTTKNSPKGLRAWKI